MACVVGTFCRKSFYRHLVKQRRAVNDLNYCSRVNSMGAVKRSLSLLHHRTFACTKCTYLRVNNSSRLKNNATSPVNRNLELNTAMVHTLCCLNSNKTQNVIANTTEKEQENLNFSSTLTLDDELRASVQQYHRAKEEVEAKLSGKRRVGRYNPEGELHVPVLLQEVLDCFRHLENKTIIDMTFGSGGHSKALLDMLPGCHVYALDRDPAAFQLAQELSETGANSVRPLLGKFSDLPKLLSSKGVKLNSIGGVLMDLGASSMQFDQSERGFSLSMNGPLDMRMDMNRNESSATAADVINALSESDLTLILKKYGEEKRAAIIAHGIVEARSAYGRITTTHQLADIVEAACQGGFGMDKLGRVSHPATKTFQALRIFVNNELNELDIGLRVAHKYLQKGGICAAIAFHSLEEKLVKNHFYNIHVDETHEKYFQNRQYSRTQSAAIIHSQEDVAKLTERKWKPFENGAFTPRDSELEGNPRSRSAIMHAAMKNV